MGITNHNKRRIGWMGGSFNPIHYGHLALAENAREAFQLEKVLFVPNGNPGYPKKETPIDPYDRLEMVQLAIRDNPFFDVSAIEIVRAKPCYSIDTLRLLTEKFPLEIFQYYFITGTDTIQEFPSWKDPVQVLEMTDFIAGCRPGFSIEKVLDKIKYFPGCQEKVHFLDIPLLEISSSEIRERIRSKKTIRYLVPDAVFAYINDKNLYQ